MPNTRAATKPKLGRPRHLLPPKFIQLRLPKDLHQRMKERAAAETMDLTVWIRRACLLQLRRKAA